MTKQDAEMRLLGNSTPTAVLLETKDQVHTFSADLFPAPLEQSVMNFFINNDVHAMQLQFF